jgi:hypothetical protein
MTESLIQGIPVNMKTVTTEEYNVEHLKASWKNATYNDWLDHIGHRVLNLKEVNETDPNPFYGIELLLLAKKLELVAKEMGGTSIEWLDPRE